LAAKVKIIPQLYESRCIRGKTQRERLLARILATRCHRRRAGASEQERERERETNFADDKQCIFAPQTSVAASDLPFLGLCDGSPAINAAIFLEKVLMPAALDKFFIAQTTLR